MSEDAAPGEQVHPPEGMEDYFRAVAVPNAPPMTAKASSRYGVDVLGPPLVVRQAGGPLS